MKNNMKELVNQTPTGLRAFLYGIFIVYSIVMAIIIPLAIFALGALMMMFCIHIVLNVPAVRCTEEPLYGEDPQGFIDQKIKKTYKLWTESIIVMAIIYAVLAGLMIYTVNVGIAYANEIPQFDLVSSLVIMMISLSPFIPATFALMIASYEYEERLMSLVSLLLSFIAPIIIPAILLWYSSSLPFDHVAVFHSFDIFPYLPISICLMAASLIITYYLSISAKRSFIRYINDENV